MLDAAQIASCSLEDRPEEEIPAPAQGSRFVPQAVTPAPGPRVMIVDDEERNIKLLRALLARENYQISTFLNGRDALSSIKHSAAQTRHTGMSGLMSAGGLRPVVRIWCMADTSFFFIDLLLTIVDPT